MRFVVTACPLRQHVLRHYGRTQRNKTVYTLGSSPAVSALTGHVTSVGTNIHLPVVGWCLFTEVTPKRV